MTKPRISNLNVIMVGQAPLEAKELSFQLSLIRIKIHSFGIISTREEMATKGQGDGEKCIKIIGIVLKVGGMPVELLIKPYPAYSICLA